MGGEHHTGARRPPLRLAIFATTARGTTVAAMTGALAGAFAGTAALPPALLAKLEDGPLKGRTHITELAAKLLERHTETRGDA